MTLQTFLCIKLSLVTSFNIFNIISLSYRKNQIFRKIFSLYLPTFHLIWSGLGINVFKALIFYYISEYFIKPLDNIEVLEGYDVMFDCEVLEENATAIWYKDGVELTASESQLISTSGKRHYLEIISADLNDAGTYSVKINNRERRGYLQIKGIQRRQI